METEAGRNGGAEMTAYYNDNEPFVAQWLRNLIGAGLVAPGNAGFWSDSEIVTREEGGNLSR